MQYLKALFEDLSETFLHLANNPALLVYGLIFLAVIILVIAVFGLFGGTSPVERRLTGQSTQLIAEQVQQDLRRKDRERPWNKLLEKLETALSGSNAEKKSTIRQKMIHAGYFGRTAVRNYYAIRVATALGFPLLFLVWLAVTPTELSLNVVLFVSVGVCAVGLLLPTAWVNRKIAMRQLAVQESFPDSLDMMVVCVEAGLGLDAAMNRVGAQIAPAHPILAQHFGVAALELRAGKSREEAMRGFSSRIGLIEINSFVTLLIQSDNLGTSIAQTLRVYADEMRANRMLRAEEKAMRLPVMLSIPLVIGILPSMLTVALLPAIIRVVRVLLPALGGG